MRVVHVHVNVCQLLPSAAQNQIFPAVKQPATFLDQLHCAHAFEVGEIISLLPARYSDGCISLLSAHLKTSSRL